MHVFCNPDTLRGLNFLLICKTMTILWVCGADACWNGKSYSGVGANFSFTYYVKRSFSNQCNFQLLNGVFCPPDFLQGAILLWS